MAYFGAENTAAFLSFFAGNATAVEVALCCTGYLASPVAAQQVDLRLFDIPAANGSTTIGLVFVRDSIYTLLNFRVIPNGS